MTVDCKPIIRYCKRLNLSFLSGGEKSNPCPQSDDVFHCQCTFKSKFLLLTQGPLSDEFWTAELADTYFSNP